MRTELRDTRLHWYVAVLVVSSRAGQPPLHPPLVDLQYRLLRANDGEGAYQRALELGRLARHSYANDEGEMVTWECFGLHDLRELDGPELADGAEVYSQIGRYDPARYVVEKDRLSCFFDEANKNTSAGGMIDDTSRA